MAEETEIPNSVKETKEADIDFDFHANTKTLSWMDEDFFHTVIQSYLKDPNAKVSHTECLVT